MPLLIVQCICVPTFIEFKSTVAEMQGPLEIQYGCRFLGNNMFFSHSLCSHKVSISRVKKLKTFYQHVSLNEIEYYYIEFVGFNEELKSRV